VFEGKPSWCVLVFSGQFILKFRLNLHKHQRFLPAQTRIMSLPVGIKPSLQST